MKLVRWGIRIFTEADSLDELKTMLRDAINCYFLENDKPQAICLRAAEQGISHPIGGTR